jgi:hypothetical protein
LLLFITAGPSSNQPASFFKKRPVVSINKTYFCYRQRPSRYTRASEQGRDSASARASILNLQTHSPRALDETIRRHPSKWCRYRAQLPHPSLAHAPTPLAHHPPYPPPFVSAAPSPPRGAKSPAHCQRGRLLHSHYSKAHRPLLFHCSSPAPRDRQTRGHHPVRCHRLHPRRCCLSAATLCACVCLCVCVCARACMRAWVGGVCVYDTKRHLPPTEFDGASRCNTSAVSFGGARTSTPPMNAGLYS